MAENRGLEESEEIVSPNKAMAMKEQFSFPAISFPLSSMKDWNQNSREMEDIYLYMQYISSVYVCGKLS